MKLETIILGIAGVGSTIAYLANIELPFLPNTAFKSLAFIFGLLFCVDMAYIFISRSLHKKGSLSSKNDEMFLNMAFLKLQRGGKSMTVLGRAGAFVLLLSIFLLLITDNSWASNCSKASELAKLADSYSSYDINSAEKTLRKAIGLCRQSAALRYNLATVLYEKKEYKEVVGTLQDAIKIKSDYAKAFNLLAIIFLDHLDNQPLAEKYASSAVAIDRWNDGYRETLNRARMPKYPPMLVIKDISFQNVLNALETAELAITVKNEGQGEAKGVYLELEGELQGLSFQKRTDFPVIEKTGGEQTVRIPVKGDMDLPSATANIDIVVKEPFYKMEKRKRLSFATSKFLEPQLTIIKFTALERQTKNNQIDIGDQVDVKFAVQNLGPGNAEDISVVIENTQTGVMFLGVKTDNDAELVRTHPHFSKIEAGNFKIITYSYFVNSELKDKELKFVINLSEKFGKFGGREIKTVAINTELKDEGEIRYVATDSKNKGFAVLSVPDFVADVDVDIPKTGMKQPDAMAVVIGNSAYKKIAPVDYAINDARTVKKYLIDVLGYKEGNILYYENVSKADFETIFGNKDNHKGKLFGMVKENKSDVFIYYSGHGVPGEDKKGYLAPIEIDGDYAQLGGYDENVFFENLSKIPAKSITVVLDACFSGEGIIKNASSIGWQVDNPAINLKNGVVFSSSARTELSNWYNEKKHGMFTYFFLKALYDAKKIDPNKDGSLTADEIYTYLSDNSEGVPYYARRIHGRKQTPTIEGKDKGRELVKY